MAAIWKPQPWDVLEAWLKAIQEEASDTLNDWETNFIEDISVRVANRWSLSERQEKRLEFIYAEKTK